MGQFRNKLINTEGASIIIVSDDEWDMGTVLLYHPNDLANMTNFKCNRR